MKRTDQKFKEVTKEEFDRFVAQYPRPLEWDVLHFYDPPLGQYNDFTKGDWPKSVVASISLDDPPRGSGRTYYIPNDSHEFEKDGSGI